MKRPHVFGSGVMNDIGCNGLQGFGRHIAALTGTQGMQLFVECLARLGRFDASEGLNNGESDGLICLFLELSRERFGGIGIHGLRCDCGSSSDMRVLVLKEFQDF